MLSSKLALTSETRRVKLLAVHANLPRAREYAASHLQSRLGCTWSVIQQRQAYGLLLQLLLYSAAANERGSGASEFELLVVQSPPLSRCRPDDGLANWLVISERSAAPWRCCVLGGYGVRQALLFRGL